jgi:hypothetical protein
MYLKGKIIPVIFLTILGMASVCSADNVTVLGIRHTVVEHRQYSFSRSLGIDAVVDLIVGLLALIMLTVSALAYLRDRRIKFLIVSAAFLMYSVKGALGVLDVLIPRESSTLLEFSDILDLVVLLLFFLAVMKD